MNLKKQCDSIDAAVEARDQYLVYEMYGPIELKCSWCSKEFADLDGLFESIHDTSLTFCSEDCRDNWDDRRGGLDSLAIIANDKAFDKLQKKEIT